MFRARRNPLAGLLLLAILTPLLAAGPGMPCAGADREHHDAAGHVTDHGEAAMPSGMHTTGVTQAPASTDDAPAPPPCAMGMLCSGTVVTPVSATIGAVPVVRSLPIATTAWAPHLSDLSIPDRPPRA